MFCIGLISEYFGIQFSFLLLTLLAVGVLISTIWLERYLLRNRIEHRKILHHRHKEYHHHHVFAHVHSHSSRRH